MYKFDPIYRPMIWGSELWVLSGYPERISLVSEGPCKGMTVNELIAAKKDLLTGKATYAAFGDEFPLLIKFIDAHQDLSIQVHPDEEMAQRIHGGHGKTEMWYVLKTEEGAHLYAGLSKEITPEEYSQRIADDTIVDVLADHRIAPGDVFFLPAGRVHAICGGTYLAEIQQTSDLTYRIYDYNRPGADGKPRQLHTDLAKQAIDYKVYDDYRTAWTPVKDKENEIVKCPYFTTSVLDLDNEFSKDLSDLDSFVVLMCIGGSCKLTTEESGDADSACSIDLKDGEVALVPACATRLNVIPDEAGCKLLTSQV